MKKIKKSLLKSNEINSPDLWERIDDELYAQERENSIVTKCNRKIYKFSFKKIIAICACLALICSIPVAASQIKNYFCELYNNTEDFQEDILNCVYTDQNEHLKITVEQILTDKIICHAIVSYTALDEIGQEIVDSYIDNPPRLEVVPNIKDNNCVVYGVNYASCQYGKLLDSNAAKETKYFITSFEASGDNYGTDSIIFRYILPESINDIESFNEEYTDVSLFEITEYRNEPCEICMSKKLSISEGMEFKIYSIDGVQESNKKYIPKQVKLSPLTISIYGTDLRTDDTPFSDKIDDIFVIFNDGTKLDISDGFQLSPVNNDNNINLMICTYNFFEIENYYFDRQFTPQDLIQTDDITGIEIDGVYYELK